jgi:hypothetical protein
MTRKGPEQAAAVHANNYPGNPLHASMHNVSQMHALLQQQAWRLKTPLTSKTHSNPSATTSSVSKSPCECLGVSCLGAAEETGHFQTQHTSNNTKSAQHTDT